MLRAGFLKGVWRHALTIPRLIYLVRGWPCLLADCLGLRRSPYKVRTRTGVRCELRPGTSDWWIFLEVFVFGIYQRADADIRQARVIIDVGANVGLFAIYASSLKPEVKVHAFEPFPQNVAHMRKNLMLNCNRNTRVHPEALSDKGGAVTLYFSPGDDSGCTLNQVRDHSCQVSAIGVNEVFKTCGTDQCDLLKLDCEGSELPILRAATPEVLTKVKAVIMEFHSACEVEALVQILSRAGFKCEVLERIKTIYASRG